ncbi:MAG: hypothetical protein WCX46_02205 [Candidatus Paceibacterota bacterium]
MIAVTAIAYSQKENKNNRTEEEVLFLKKHRSSRYEALYETFLKLEAEYTSDKDFFRVVALGYGPSMDDAYSNAKKTSEIKLLLASGLNLFNNAIEFKKKSYFYNDLSVFILVYVLNKN